MINVYDEALRRADQLVLEIDITKRELNHLNNRLNMLNDKLTTDEMELATLRNYFHVHEVFAATGNKVCTIEMRDG